MELFEMAADRGLRDIQQGLANAKVRWENKIRLRKNLFDAAKKGDLHQLIQLVSQGADVNAADKDTAFAPIKGKNKVPPGGCIALHFAKDLETARQLLALKADLNAKNSHGCTPLMTILQRNEAGSAPVRLSIARELVRAKADVRAVDKSGDNVLRHAVQRHEQLPLIRLLVRDGGLKPDRRVMADATAHAGKRKQKPEVVEFLMAAATAEDAPPVPEQPQLKRFRLRFLDPTDPAGLREIEFGTPEYHRRLKQLLEDPVLQTLDYSLWGDTPADAPNPNGASTDALSNACGEATA